MLPLALWALVASTPPAAETRAPSQPRAAAEATSREFVVLVHGLGRTRYSMNPLARALSRAGYTVVKYGYPSYSAPVEQLAPDLARRIEEIEADPDVAKVHLVGHSLGNIMIRWVVANQRPAKLGRIVMLAPPNKGARKADEFAPWCAWLAKTLPDLTTAETSAARRLNTPLDLEIGIIAGSKDKDVQLDETHLDFETDHIVVESGHNFIMRHSEVHRLTLAFLANGRFRD